MRASIWHLSLVHLDLTGSLGSLENAGFMGRSPESHPLRQILKYQKTFSSVRRPSNILGFIQFFETSQMAATSCNFAEGCAMNTETKRTNEEDRMTAIGLFNYAHSYWSSASELHKLKISNITHPKAPVYFLYVHAVELFLKSNLRLTKTPKELKQIKHGATALMIACKSPFRKK